MHVHIPKAFHGWREFAKEVGIIVLGVLIALAGEQVVEGYHQREAATSASEAINAELLYAAFSAGERIALDTCMRNRIAHLGGKLATSGDQWTGDPMPFAKLMPGMPVLPMTYSVPATNYMTNAWDMAVANGLSRHMSHETSELYAVIYRGIADVKASQQEEGALAAKLQPLSQTRKLDARSAFESATTLGSLDFLNSSIVFADQALLSNIKKLDIDLGPAQKALSEMLQTQRQLRGPCVKPASLR